MDILGQVLGGNAGQQISGLLGADTAKTKSGMALALPALLGALSKNASKPEGLDSLTRAVKQDHDGSILDDLGGFLGKAATGPGAGILKHVLGAKRSGVEGEISRASGLGGPATSQLMEMLAPILMGAIGKSLASGGGQGLAAMLSGASRQAAGAAPAGMAGIFGMLDLNKDGSMMDDVVRMGGGFFKRLFGMRR